MPYHVTDLLNGNLFELAIYCKSQDQIAVNVLHYACSFTDTSNLNMQDLCDDFEAAFRAVYPAMIPNTAVYRGCSLRRLRTGKTATFYSSHAATGGTNENEALPYQVSGLIRLRANVAGRRGRGRVYIPFPCLPDSDNNLPIAGYVTRLNAIADEITTVRVHADEDGEHTNSFSPCIRHANAEGTDDDTYDLVTSAMGVGKWATQRRRGNFGRPNILPW